MYCVIFDFIFFIFIADASWVSLEEVVHAQDENTIVDLLIHGYNPNDTTSFKSN